MVGVKAEKAPGAASRNSDLVLKAAGALEGLSRAVTPGDVAAVQRRPRMRPGPGGMTAAGTLARDLGPTLGAGNGEGGGTDLGP